MRPTLTVASSLTPRLPWWRNVSLPSGMVASAIRVVSANIANAAGEDAPVTGVAVVIRVPGSLPPEECPTMCGTTWRPMDAGWPQRVEVVAL